MPNNELLIPSNTYQPGQKAIDKEELRLSQELSFHHAQLDSNQQYNTGEETVILTSGADGSGSYSIVDSIYHEEAGNRLELSLLKYDINHPTIVNDAKVADLHEAVADKSVANILLIGHGTYHSWVATDGAVDWFMAGKMADRHLKNGLFANLGCGAITSWNYIPLGRFVVGSNGVLWGKSKEYATIKDTFDLRNYTIL